MSLLSLIVGTGLLLTGQAVPGEAVVVCPPEFLPALEPWIEHRTQQGHRLTVVQDTASCEEIRAAVRKRAKAGRVKFVVLVGDAAANASQPADQPLVPTWLEEAKVNVHWGSESQIATDNPYADLNDDGVPDLAIGRIPADSVADVETFVRKVLKYEAPTTRANWRRRINVVAGVGGFGPLADSVLETATKKFLTDGIPSSYQVGMTYGSWRSPFCPDPRSFRDMTVARLNEGCLFWVYIGHGQRWFLDRVRTPGKSYHILGQRDLEDLNCANGSPIAVFLACYTGAFDDPRDCLAEEMLRAAGGPVAVFSGSRVAMPYAMAVMGNAMLDEYFRRGRETLGEVILHARHRLVDDAPADTNNENRLMLDALAGAISPLPDQLDDERREHNLLFNLLGDPMLRLPQAERFELHSAEEIVAGQRLRITGRTSVTGLGQLELVARRDKMKTRLPARNRFNPSPDVLATYNETWQQANDRVWGSWSFDFSGGEFQTDLPVPADARGTCVVRVQVANRTTFSLGSTEVFVRRPK